VAAEIKTGVGADAGKDISLGRAGAPCGLIYEAGLAATR
jgi:hypothetical protein